MTKDIATKEPSFSIGNYAVLPSRNLVIHEDKETLITPKMLAVLIELAKHQGETLSKEQLLLAVWGTLHTSDMVLSRAISDLRKVFSDSARQQHTIETVTKQGYRLKQSVAWQHSEEKRDDETLLPKTKVPETKVNENYDVIPSQQLSTESLTSILSSVDKGATALSPSDPPMVKTNNMKKRFVLFIFIVASLIFLAFFITSNKAILLTAEPTITYDNNYLTLDDDMERNVRFSPNGKYLAYASNLRANLGQRVKLQSITNKSLITISAAHEDEETSYDIAPTFSPDGNQIAYKHFSKSTGCTINVYTIKEATVKTLTECPMSKTDALDWSPDGQYLVTNIFNYIKKIESLVLVSTDTGKNKTLLAPSENASGYLWPRFSPDGNSIAVVHFQPNNNLWVIGLVDTLSGKFTEVTSSGEEVSQVVWNEAGNSLYYLIVRSQEQGIWQVGLNSKETTFLVEINSSSLDYDRKNDKFAYIEREAQYNIWRSVQGVDGELISAPFLKNMPQTNYPTLAPDNKSLAFISTESGVDSLWIRTIDTRANLLLFQVKDNDKLSEPTWSSDGKQLLVSILNKGRSRMVQFDMELGNSILFDSTNNVKMGKWSQDGLFMYWYEEIDDVWHVMEKNLSTAQQRIILSHPIAQFDIIDGNNLHYQKIGTRKVHTRLLDHLTSTKPKDKMLLPTVNTFTWDAHLGVIYYAADSSVKKLKMLFKMDLSSGLVEELYPIEVMDTEESRTLSVSDDGRTAYYTKLDKYRTDVVVMTQE